MKVLLLAGGIGSRLWPLSREGYPKQFLKLMNSKTSLFQDTFTRGMLLSNVDEIFVITSKKYKVLVIDQIAELGVDYKEENILIEPEAKNTLPAICYGVVEACKSESDSVVIFPSDHKILEESKLIEIIQSSEELAKDRIITFGIRPTKPKTGYGYISLGKNILNGYEVKEFVEKPNLEQAKRYIENGYLWNSGIFMFHSNVFKEELKKHAFNIFEAFYKSEDVYESFGRIQEGVSIDYGLMEKTKKVAVVPIEIDWNDLGSFDSFEEVFDKDKNDNIVNDDYLIIESSNNLVIAEKNKKVVILGVEDLIVVDRKDALLICKKNKSESIKVAVDMLGGKNNVIAEYNAQKTKQMMYLNKKN